MFCTRCGTKNAKTAKFCRECGRKLDLGIPVASPEEDELLLEQGSDTIKRVGDLLFQAFQRFEHNEYDEATKLCYEAVRLDSHNTSAHSLLGMIYEKKGDDEAAIRHYQRVLTDNPKSVADREKLEELLKRRSAGSTTVSLDETLRQYVQVALEYLASKRPWPATIGASLLTFLLLIAVWPNQPATQSGTQPQAVGQAPSAPPSLGQQNPPPTPTNASGDLNFIGGGTRPSPAPQPQYTPPAQRAPVETVAPLAAPITRQSRPAPLPSLTHITDLPPVRIEPRRAQPQQRYSAPPPAPAAPREPTPVISITRSAPSPTPAKSPVDRARSLQMSGQYDEAISAWRQALSDAKYPGGIHQQIATCYRRLGKNSEAAGSYQDAIRAYQQQVSAGHNVDEAQRGIRSSELGVRISQREGE